MSSLDSGHLKVRLYYTRCGFSSNPSVRSCIYQREQPNVCLLGLPWKYCVCNRTHRQGSGWNRADTTDSDKQNVQSIKSVSTFCMLSSISSMAKIRQLSSTPSFTHMNLHPSDLSAQIPSRSTPCRVCGLRDITFLRWQ